MWLNLKQEKWKLQISQRMVSKMFIVKLTILMWFLMFVARLFVNATISREERMVMAITGKMKMNFIRYLMVILFLLAIFGSVASLVWFLFFR